jgi:hypothetical protein
MLAVVVVALILLVLVVLVALAAVDQVVLHQHLEQLTQAVVAVEQTEIEVG